MVCDQRSSVDLCIIIIIIIIIIVIIIIITIIIIIIITEFLVRLLHEEHRCITEYYKTRRVAVMICTVLVNAQTHILTRYTISSAS